MPTVDLVADLGEGFGAYSIGDDKALLEIVSSANIACGFHAGDPDIMDATVAECVGRESASAPTRASRICAASAAAPWT